MVTHGDAVLKEFVGRIRETHARHRFLFRWGGEEFIVLPIGIGYAAVRGWPKVCAGR